VVRLNPETWIPFAEWKGHTFLALLLRWILAAVFLSACWYKILDPGDFALSVATYGILPTVFVNPFAIVLPWVELIAALMLISGFRPQAGALLMAGMMLLFTVALIIALMEGLDLSCGCFASTETGESINTMTLLRDILLLSASVYVLIYDQRPLGLDRLLEGIDK